MTKLVISFALLIIAAPAALLATSEAKSGNKVAFKKSSFVKDHHGEMDIVDTAVSTKMFKTLVVAVKAADLVDVLKSKGPFTVLAPTDEAFKKLPEGTVEKLLMPENKDMLINILKYHVIGGKAEAKDVMKMKKIKTLQGKKVKVKVKKGTVMINKAKVIKADVKASNGVIHVIDRVLMP